MVTDCVCLGETCAIGIALDMVLDRIFADPLSNSCPNVSYLDVSLVSAAGSASSAASQLHTGIIPNNPSFAMLRYSLRFCGYTESAIEDIVAAVYTLASYGFLSLSEGSADSSTDPSGFATMIGMAAASAGQSYPDYTSGNNTATNYSMSAGMSAPTNANYSSTASGFANSSSTAAAYGPYHGNYGQNSAYPYCPQGAYGSSGYPDYGALFRSDYPNANSAPPPPPPPQAPPIAQASNSAEPTIHSFEVGEHIVGALLGPGGRSIVDLQTWSGAAVEVSKKGTYAPGTRNRIVTVSGTPQAVQSATYFIKQCIDHEEMRRHTSSNVQSGLSPPAMPSANMPNQPWPTPQQTAR